jgi:tetratricopeptide (TPR) repeat protein
LTPTHLDERPSSGGGGAFIQFIEEELIPFVDDRYRTQPYRVLFGHSLGGMFAVYSLFAKPDVFAGYIAASPHLQYDDGHVVGMAEEILAGKPSLKKSLFITVGDEPDYVATLERFTAALEKAGDTDLRWEYVVMENDDHTTTPLKSTYQGLEMIFADWGYPGDLAEADVSSIQAHYENLSDEIGYEILIPEGLLNQLGYLLLSEERYDEAIAAFKLNIDNYPGSANVYDSLGELYEEQNEWGLAKVNYEKAYQRGLEIEDRNTRIYKQHLDDLLQKLSDFD